MISDDSEKLLRKINKTKLRSYLLPKNLSTIKVY